jgi:membrane protein
VRHLRLLGSALAKFNRDEGFFLASAIAYQALLCLVPFALLLLSFAGGYLVSSESAAAYFGQSIEQAAPVLDPALRENLMEIVAHRGTSGIVGTVGLLWMATAVFSGLRYALNAIFGKAQPHGALRGLAVDLGMIALAAATFLTSFGLTAAIEYVRRVQTKFLPAAPGILLQLSLSYVVPVLLAVVLCFQIYHLLPNRRVCTRSALLGAIFTGVLWEAAKHLFKWYVLAFSSYSLVYGSLSAAAVLLVWTWFSAAVLLLGAEVAVLLEQERGARGAEPRP